MLSALLILQASVAPIATGDPIAAPIPIERAGLEERPSLAARALSVVGMTDLSTTPVTVTLQCLVLANGRMGDCVPAADGGTVDPARFWPRVEQTARTSSPLLRAALARTAFYRVRLARAAASAWRSVLIREVVSAADAGPSRPATETVDQTALRVVGGDMPDLAFFYPVDARRAGAQTRVAATCRVLGDHSLWCRDPRTELVELPGPPPAWRDPAFDAAFARATLRAFAALKVRDTLAGGRDSVGREARVGLRWVLPD